MNRFLLLLALALVGYLTYHYWFTSRESSSPPAPPVAAVQTDPIYLAARDISINGSVSRMVDAWTRHMQDGFYNKEALLSIGRQEFPTIIREMHARGLYSDQALFNVLSKAVHPDLPNSERDTLVQGLLSMRPKYRDQPKETANTRNTGY